MIVIQGIQLIGADGKIIHDVRQLTIELKQAGVVDQAGAVQLFGNGIQRVGFGDGNIHRLVRTAEGQHIGGTHPKHTAQGSADGHHQSQPHDGGQNVGDAQQTVGMFVFRSSLSHGGILLSDPLGCGFFFFLCFLGFFCNFFLGLFRCRAVDFTYLAKGVAEFLVLKGSGFVKQQRTQRGIIQRIFCFLLAFGRFKKAGILADALYHHGAVQLGGGLLQIRDHSGRFRYPIRFLGLKFVNDLSQFPFCPALADAGQGVFVGANLLQYRDIRFSVGIGRCHGIFGIDVFPQLLRGGGHGLVIFHDNFFRIGLHILGGIFLGNHLYRFGGIIVILRQELGQKLVQLLLGGQVLIFVHRGSSCQRITICCATSSAFSRPQRASTSARPKGIAQPADVPVITLPSTTKALFSSIMALPMSFSQPG